MSRTRAREFDLCLESVVSDGCMVSEMESKTYFGGRMLSACCIISVCMCFISVIFGGGGLSVSKGY